MLFGILDFAVICLCCAICLAVVVKARRDVALAHAQGAESARRKNQKPVFLFYNKALVDATPQAMALLADSDDHLSEFDALVQTLAPYFPDLRTTLDNPPAEKTRINGTSITSLWLEVSQVDEQLRIAINGNQDAIAHELSSSVTQDVRLSELAMLRDVTQDTPQLIWQESNDGKLLWANKSYLKFVDQLTPAGDNMTPTWPSASIFPDLHETPGAKGTSVRRLSVKTHDQTADHWFDVTSKPYGSGFIHFATDANNIVRADQERRSFKQTLGRTFAELSIGLAIFDKQRKLSTFNPAVLDLTGLKFDFLSSRPTLDAVLDKLRESRVLPEPKNYNSWREQFSALETEAKNGTYSATWALPDGRTYRVSGRPHPDGAFAFLFEDISAEVSLTRRFRSDIETSQAVLDTVPDAIAVFSGAGNLLISNQAYADLWQTNPALYHEHRALQTEMKVWQNRCTHTRIWSQIRSFTHQVGTREAWSDSTLLDDGRLLTCHTNPIAGGKTLVRFSTKAKANPVIQKLTMNDPAIRLRRR
ncbi:PAS-domain containing protein [Loktanella sp. S4079]|uniref:PAS-domain containing protein n=1 Tax=Loktanella sp. S4079 TaxID=579483 RepID=UPI000696217A|nr:PAS-domain containing protein [Loktanella sp. S4079]